MLIDGLRSLVEGSEDICVVGEACNGQQAVELCDQQQVDIVIMDINMPEMDGIQATREILKKHPSIKILGLSMYSDRQYRQYPQSRGTGLYFKELPEWKRSSTPSIHRREGGLPARECLRITEGLQNFDFWV